MFWWIVYWTLDLSVGKGRSGRGMRQKGVELAIVLYYVNLLPALMRRFWVFISTGRYSKRLMPKTGAVSAADFSFAEQRLTPRSFANQTHYLPLTPRRGAATWIVLVWIAAWTMAKNPSHLRVFLARRTRVARILTSTPRMVEKASAGHPWSALRVVKSCRKDCPTASVLPKPKQQLCIQNGTRAYYLNYLQERWVRRGKEAQAIGLAIR